MLTTRWFSLAALAVVSHAVAVLIYEHQRLLSIRVVANRNAAAAPGRS